MRVREWVEDLATITDRVIRSEHEICQALATPGHRVQTLNLHHLQLWCEDPEFREACLSATHVTADGWPVVLLFRALGVKSPRITGSGWLAHAVKDRCLATQRAALLGGQPVVAAQFADLALANGLDIAHSETGRFADWDFSDLNAAYAGLGVSVVLVSVSPPRGELAGHFLRESGFEGSVINVGGGVGMLTGAVARAPRVVQRLGAEWLYRLAHEPRRLWRRYLVDGAPFVATHLLPAIAMTARRRLSGARSCSRHHRRP